MTASEQADFLALLMLEEGATLDPDVIAQRELEAHEAAARQHYGMT